MVYGNHDEEGVLDRQGMLDVVLSIPGAISERGPTDIDGVGNYIVQLMTSSYVGAVTAGARGAVAALARPLPRRAPPPTPKSKSPRPHGPCSV